MENYEPSIKDISKRICGDMYNGIKKAITPSRKGVIEAAEVVIGAPIAMNILPYVIPSLIAGIKNTENSNCSDTKESLVYNIGYGSAAIGGSVLFGSQAYLYAGAVINGSPEVLGIPIVTNLLSGIYEIGKKTRANLINENKQNSLESKIDE